MLVRPYPFMLYFLICLFLIYTFSYITPFEEIFWFNDTLILIFTFIIIFYYKNKYYDQIIYNEEEIEEDRDEKLNYDLFYKFVELMINELWFFYSFIFTELKKWYHFNKFIKYDCLYNSLKIFLKKKVKNKFVIWRPIFKKWSYLGYYRANRSKWIK